MVAQDQYYKDSEVELNISCIFSEINGAVLFTFYSYLKNKQSSIKIFFCVLYWYVNLLVFETIKQIMLVIKGTPRHVLRKIFIFTIV